MKTQNRNPWKLLVACGAAIVLVSGCGSLDDGVLRGTNDDQEAMGNVDGTESGGPIACDANEACPEGMECVTACFDCVPEDPLCEGGCVSHCAPTPDPNEVPIEEPSLPPEEPPAPETECEVDADCSAGLTCEVHCWGLLPEDGSEPGDCYGICVPENIEEPPLPCEEPVRPCDEPVGPCDEPVGPCDEPVGPCDEPVGPCDEPVGPCDEPVGPCDEPVPTCEPPPVGPCDEPIDPCEPMGPCGEPIDPCEPMGPCGEPIDPCEPMGPCGEPINTCGEPVDPCEQPPLPPEEPPLPESECQADADCGEGMICAVACFDCPHDDAYPCEAGCFGVCEPQGYPEDDPPLPEY